MSVEQGAFGLPSPSTSASLSTGKSLLCCFGCGNTTEDTLHSDHHKQGASVKYGGNLAPLAVSGASSSVQLHQSCPPYKDGVKVSTGTGSSTLTSQSSSKHDLNTALTKSGLNSVPTEDVVAVKRLVCYLKDGNHRLRAMAAEAMFKAAKSKQPVAEMLATCDIVHSLVDMLKTGTEQGKVYASHTLYVLVESAQFCRDAVNEEAVEALLEVAKGSSLAAARKGALKALGRMVRHREASAKVMEVDGHKVMADTAQSKLQKDSMHCRSWHLST